jgi:hypothetical protein
MLNMQREGSNLSIRSLRMKEGSYTVTDANRVRISPLHMVCVCASTEPGGGNNEGTTLFMVPSTTQGSNGLVDAAIT